MLVVEDDPSIMLGLRINLETEGYAVLSAEDGERALALVRDEPPDLVILDVMLPKMNGLQVLLIVPAQPPDRIGDVLAIAWKDTAEAAGAVTAGLPLLEGARQVVILSVTEDEQADRAACQRLREALEWHNPATTVQHLARSGEEPARTLLKAAANLGVDLLVMGAYGHSRARSLVFGGMTGQVLRAADLPVLCSRIESEAATDASACGQRAAILASLLRELSGFGMVVDCGSLDCRLGCKLAIARAGGVAGRCAMRCYLSCGAQRAAVAAGSVR